MGLRWLSLALSKELKLKGLFEAPMVVEECREEQPHAGYPSEEEEEEELC